MAYLQIAEMMRERLEELEREAARVQLEIISLVDDKYADNYPPFYE